MRYFLQLVFFSICLLLPSFALSTPSSSFERFRSTLRLGKVDLKVSSSNPQAQAHFNLGLTFLHAFMYELAIEQFKQAQHLDSGFMMAYWGEAMAYKHPIWNHEDLTSGRMALRKMLVNRDSRLLNLKEKGLINAISMLYSSKPLAVRDKQYSNVLQKLHQQFPKDPDVGAFYALSLIGLASDIPEDSQNIHRVIEGRRLIDSLFKTFPNHPGVVHYSLHYYDVDNPKLAKKALPAAEIALEMMNSSSHVAHMSAHLYRRLGLWEKYNKANEISIAAADSLCLQLANLKSDAVKPEALYACNADNKFHSLEWLHFGYLQLKRNKEAQRLLTTMANVAQKDPDVRYQQWYYRIYARQVLLGPGQWEETIEVTPIAKKDDQLFWSAYSECGALLAKGMSRLQEKRGIEDISNRLATIIKLTANQNMPFIHRACQISALELQAEHADKQKNHQAALGFMNAALKLQKLQKSTPVSPSLPILPAEIYYAEKLIAWQQNIPQAIALYQQLLKQYPNLPQAKRRLATLSAQIKA